MGLSLQGCLNVERVKQDISRRRADRFRGWKLERSGEGRERQVRSGGLSLQTSIAIALRSSREIQMAREEKTKARHRITEAWSEAYPRVDVGADYVRLDRAASTSAGGQKVKIGSKNNYDVNVTVTQPLLRGGATSAGVRAAVLYEWFTDEQFRSTRQQIIFAARKAYYDAFLTRELWKASEKSVEVAEQLLEDAKKDRAAGMASDFDVLRAEVEVKNFKAQSVQAANRHKLAITSLLDVIGLSQESQIELTDSLAYEPLAADTEAEVKTAFMNHPDLLMGELEVRMKEEVIKIEKSGYYPKLDAFFSPQYARPKPSDPTRRNSWGHAWSAGLSLTFPLFEGFRTRSRVAQAKADFRKSEIALRDTEEGILLAIKQAILSMEDADKFVESQEANREQAAEALRLVRLGREQGIRKQVEELDAQRALDQAMANYWQAVYQHQMAKLALEKATGTLDATAADDVGRMTKDERPRPGHETRR